MPIFSDPKVRQPTIIPEITPSVGTEFAPAAASLRSPTLGTQGTTVAPSAGQGVALTETQTLPTNVPATAILVLLADPVNPVVGQIWYRSDLSQLSIRHDASTTKRSAGFT